MTGAPHIKNRNAQGFVVKRAGLPDLPFLRLKDAVEYCKMREMPDDADHLIYDPASARQLAAPLLREAEYLQMLLKNKWERTDVELKALCRQRDKLKAKPRKNIFDQAELNMLDDKINEAVGIFSGVYAAITVNDDRLMELWQITRLSCPRTTY